MTETFTASDGYRIESPYGDFDINPGLPADLVDQLVAKSREDHIMQWTPKDATKRFVDAEAVGRHIERGRQMYALTQNGDLAGVIWYGPKPFADGKISHPANHTFAIRMYQTGEGRHLSRRFMDYSLRDYLVGLMQSPAPVDFKGLWLSTELENRARLLYARYGYQEVGQIDNEVFMVLSEDKIREVAGA